MCLVPYLLRGVGFPIHSFLRGLLEYYGLQLHNFTPASILHIAGYVSLCELFLGVEAHFELWRKLFCLVPRNHEGSIFEVGGPKYGASPIPDIHPAHQGRHMMDGPPNGSILRTSRFLTQFERVFLNL